LGIVETFDVVGHVRLGFISGSVQLSCRSLWSQPLKGNKRTATGDHLAAFRGRLDPLRAEHQKGEALGGGCDQTTSM
jgi:hypothetical protein